MLAGVREEAVKECYARFQLNASPVSGGLPTDTLDFADWNDEHNDIHARAHCVEMDEMGQWMNEHDYRDILECSEELRPPTLISARSSQLSQASYSTRPVSRRDWPAPWLDQDEAEAEEDEEDEGNFIMVAGEIVPLEPAAVGPIAAPPALHVEAMHERVLNHEGSSVIVPNVIRNETDSDFFDEEEWRRERNAAQRKEELGELVDIALGDMIVQISKLSLRRLRKQKATARRRMKKVTDFFHTQLTRRQLDMAAE